MSGQDWPVGTVASATVGLDSGVLVMKCGGTDRCWVSAETCTHATDEFVTDVRPLVVLDPEMSDVEEFLKVEDGPMAGWMALRFASFLAELIREQTKPPRIPEPGLWGVVEDKDGRQYVHVDPVRGDAFAWQLLGEPSDHGNCYVRWSEIDSPVLIRPGIEEGS